MAELKTQKTTASVDAFLNTIADESIRNDCTVLVNIMEAVTGAKATMWGTSIVGFGSYRYKSEKSAQQGEWFLVGFSPRKANISIYIMAGFEKMGLLLTKLGKYKTSKGCLYVRRLSEIDTKVLEVMIKHSVAQMRKMYAS